jgi:hypothetical protein
MALLAASLSGCAESAEMRAGAAEVRDSAGVRIVENTGGAWQTPWHIAAQPTVTIGSAEGDTTQLLFRVTGALRLRDGSIVIANAGTNELLFFDAAGTYTHRAGGEGEGPGEFRGLSWLSRFGEDSLVAMDIRARRLSYFDSEGRFGRSVRLEPNPDLPFPGPVGMFDDGTLLVTQGAFMLGAEGPTRVERSAEELYRYSADGQTATVLGTFPGVEFSISPTGTTLPGGGDRYGQGAREFGRRTGFAARGQRYCVADNATYEINVYDLDAGLTLVIRKQHTPVPVTDDDVRGLREARLARVTDPNRRRAIQRAQSMKPEPPATMPAYAASIRLDAAGNLWVPEYAQPGAYSLAWSVFSESGQLLGVVDLPEAISVLDIGLDYVLGLRTDELGVQYIQVYQLAKEG